MRPILSTLLLLCVLGCLLSGLPPLPLTSPVRAGDGWVVSKRERFHPVLGRRGMVASQEARATRVGVEILRRGGNAVDAAAGVGFTLAVTLPRAGNLGGGGFMLLHEAETGSTVALDYRETAPSAATEDMFLDGDGEVDEARCRDSRDAAGVPGTVAGLALALERWGTMSLAEVLAPAIRYAREGIVLTASQAALLEEHRERLAVHPATARIFYRPDGGGYAAGETLVQADLAASLEAIAARGPRAFYEGVIAERLVADMRAHGGRMTAADLAGYRPVLREPVRGTYRGYEVVSMPPPSSGGVHLIQMLNVLEGWPLGYLGPGAAETIHLMAETMKRAYADRSLHLGDPDFADVPVEGLLSKSYAAALRAQVDRHRATPAAQLGPGDPVRHESTDTTHFTVMDQHGNVVTNTFTLNFPYGSGIVAAGTGILLNNEMDDFSAKPGTPNAYGLVGGAANRIEPGKRPLSSMTPTIVFRDGAPFLATGSPGGSRIITTTLQVIVNVIDHGMSIASATAAPRVHHQWLPDELRVESGIGVDTIRLLARFGHTVVVQDAMGSAQSVMRTEDGFLGCSDPRRPDALTLGW